MVMKSRFSKSHKFVDEAEMNTALRKVIRCSRCDRLYRNGGKCVGEVNGCAVYPNISYEALPKGWLKSK